MQRGGAAELMLNDVRYGLRMLRKSPGFTAVAVVTLALGIGANTAIFSVVRAVLLPPLPFANPGRLVEIQLRDRKTGAPANWVAYRDVADWRAQNRSFESIGAHRFALLNLTAAGQPDALYGRSGSAVLLPLLGVPPLAGRFFLPAEDQPGHEQEIILSYDLWQRRFAGDPSIVGRTIRLQVGAGTGLLYLLRWFWWRITAWCEIVAMISSFGAAIVFLILKKNGVEVAFSEHLLIGIAITT